MKLSYDRFIRYEVYQILHRVGSSDLERVSNFMEALAGDPFRKGDATTLDEHGRDVQVKMLGRLALFYWVDHAEKEVRVVDLANASE
jgi:hypothetical protein